MSNENENILDRKYRKSISPESLGILEEFQEEIRRYSNQYIPLGILFNMPLGDIMALCSPNSIRIDTTPKSVRIED